MIEQELKLTASDSLALQAIIQSEAVKDVMLPGQIVQPKRYLARYYDTIDWALLQHTCSLRARLEGDRYVAALKMPGRIVNGLSSREEFETPITGWMPALQDLPDSLLKQALSTLIDLDRKVVSRIEVDTQRTICNLRLENSQVELVCDYATMRANHRERTLYEVELELKDGPIEPLLAFGDVLRHQYDLIPSTTTKHQIGLSLFDDKPS